MAVARNAATQARDPTKDIALGTGSWQGGAYATCQTPPGAVSLAASGVAGAGQPGAANLRVTVAPPPGAVSLAAAGEAGTGQAGAANLGITAAPAPTALHRLDSTAALEALFVLAEPVNSNEGAWEEENAGAGSSGTGPTNISDSPYVISDTSSSPDDPAVATNSALTLLPAVEAQWTGTRRSFEMRVCISGNFDTATEGFELRARASDSDAWARVQLWPGWDNAPYTVGDTITDGAGNAQTCSADGGWVDFDVEVPDAATQFQLRTLVESTSNIDRRTHDVALWHVTFRNGGEAGAAVSLAASGVAGAGQPGAANLRVTVAPPPVAVSLAATGAAGAGQAGAADLSITAAALQLADFDQTGLDVDVLALFVAAAPTDVYADANRGGTQTPAEGEMGIGAGQTLITRIRILDSGDRIALNDDDVPVALDMAAHFGAPNTVSAWTVTFQTAAGVASSTQLVSTGSAFAQYSFGADDAALLGGIGAGERVIIAVTQPQAVPPVSLAAVGVAGAGQPGAANLSVTTPAAGAVSLAAVGEAGAGQAGTANLRVTTPPPPGAVSLAAVGEAGAGQAGTANLRRTGPLPPPVTGGITVSVDGVDVSDDVLGSPPVVTQRGSSRRAAPFVPQVDSAELTLRSAAPVEDGVAIAVRQVSPARTLFSGTVAEAQNRDSLAANVARIRADDLLAALSGPGPSVALMTAPLVSEAIAAVLEACGIGAAERAITASTRRLYLFWLDPDDQPIRILQQLVATDGPGARLYIDGDGLVRFEPDGTRTTQARSTAVQATYDAAARVANVPAARNVAVAYQAENPPAGRP